MKILIWFNPEFVQVLSTGHSTIQVKKICTCVKISKKSFIKSSLKLIIDRNHLMDLFTIRSGSFKWYLKRFRTCTRLTLQSKAGNLVLTTELKT